MLIREFVEDEIRERLTEESTPVQKVGNIWLKRDDLFSVNGSRGGKARSCAAICERGIKDGYKGFVTAGSKKSPQVQIVSFLAKMWGVPFRAHIPSGEYGYEIEVAKANGAEIVQHKAGYNNVIIARAREDAEEKGYLEIPFGMECEEAIYQTGAQVKSIKDIDFKRLVIPLGSGMSLSGVLWGMEVFKIDKPVLAVQVGAKYEKRLDKWAPVWWKDENYLKIVKSKYKYHDYYPNNEVEGVLLDPIYEAKCLDFIEDGDLLWCVGIRDGIDKGVSK